MKPASNLVEAAIDDGFEAGGIRWTTSFVRDPNAEGGPIVSLSTPDYEAEITAPTMVVGTVQDDSLAGWTLAWPKPAPRNWTILAEGTEPINEAEIAMFDPTLLINGQYRIALQAWTTRVVRTSIHASPGDRRHEARSFRDHF